ncbi:cytochrome c [Aestuariicoccus sp. MJ-SS9]|uniref:c-type cytochrome n=1 Tax=Aestuariicoccus sp. MJ-SS9 TaxID=3079855 RepID=UPI00290F9734|nr:cytochrome c [Aestuariicoccus sp. MJ-SS9]MDU8912254.1 cytochrome c [Aestuariicoccus sp. MJ-SS9]
MRRLGILFAAMLLMAMTTTGALVVWPIPAETPDIADIGDVQAGAYLARASGCISCHTDFENGGRPLAGGVPFKTPFGTLISPNITTDPEHGIGSWTTADFARAVRQGISPDGHPYYPAFTYPFYGSFTDQQIADLWAAFQTVAPVAEDAPDHDLAFPFNQRWTLKAWRAAFLTEPATDPVEGMNKAWNRGRVLVEGAAHCGACHTERNLAGARMSDRKFMGNPDLPGSDAPPITAEVLENNGWTISNLAYALKTGLTPEGDVFGGSMGEVVNYGTAFLTDADRKAIATYLLMPEAEKFAQR